MATDTIIAERPIPPKGRLSFPMLILRMIVNPVASWGEDFYEEPAVLYRWLGLQTLYVMDPVLIQRILFEDAESYSKQPLNDDVFGEAIGGGLLNAEGDEWRWQRRLAAPLFRAEEMLAYVPAFAAVCTPLLKRWKDSGAGALQRIDRDMTGTTLQALQDTVLGRAWRGESACHSGGRRYLPLLLNVEGCSYLAATPANNPSSWCPEDGSGRPDAARYRPESSGQAKRRERSR